jgi:hypothetical protein
VSDEVTRRRLPDSAERAIGEILGSTDPHESVRHLANVANRAIALVHKLAREQAALRKGHPDWATWAKLVNASRSAVLASSVTREVTAELASSRAPDASIPGADAGDGEVE